MLNPDFSAFVRSLDASRVRYLVVGGYAVAFHGHPRYTKDLDLWIDASPDNAQRVVEIVDGQPIAFIDLNGLLRNKRASGRHQDLADVEELEAGNTDRTDDG